MRDRGYTWKLWRLKITLYPVPNILVLSYLAWFGFGLKSIYIRIHRIWVTFEWTIKGQADDIEI